MRTAHDRTAIRIGDLVTDAKGGPIMRVARVEDSVAVCVWCARHKVIERAVTTAALSRVAPGRLVPIWGYWGDASTARSQSQPEPARTR